MNQVCLVGTYFGRWPAWFPATWASMVANKGCDWLILTDCSLPQDIPDHIRIVESSVADLNQRASRALGFEVSKGAYAQCDLLAHPVACGLGPDVIAHPPEIADDLVRDRAAGTGSDLGQMDSEEAVLVGNRVRPGNTRAGSNGAADHPLPAGPGRTPQPRSRSLLLDSTAAALVVTHCAVASVTATRPLCTHPPPTRCFV